MIPKVSIGLPVYNGETFIIETLDSLLSQSFTDFEIVISDNASTDSTESICRTYADKDDRIKYHRYEVNKGAAWNFNNCFHLSKGEYFKWAAHDDPYMPSFLNACVRLLDKKPEVVLCFTRTMFIDDFGDDVYECIYPINLFTSDRRTRFRRFAQGGYIVHEIFGLIRADVLRETPLICGYMGSDLVLLGMLTLKGPFFQVDEVLFKHREHAQRSMKNPQGAKNTTQWFDSSKTGDFVLPYLRRSVENAKSVLSARNMLINEKIYCLYDIVRVAYWNRRDHQDEIHSNFGRILSKINIFR